MSLATFLLRRDTSLTRTPYWAALIVGVVIVALLSSLVSFGLLCASKTSWWLTQASFVWGIYSLVHTRLVPHPAHPHSYAAPLPLRLLSWGASAVLCLYILTPAMRRFFFARPKPIQDGANWPN